MGQRGSGRASFVVIPALPKQWIPEVRLHGRQGHRGAGHRLKSELPAGVIGRLDRSRRAPASVRG